MIGAREEVASADSLPRKLQSVIPKLNASSSDGPATAEVARETPPMKFSSAVPAEADSNKVNLEPVFKKDCTWA